MSDPRQQAARQKRLAAALRANLKRRKEGARTSPPADASATSAHGDGADQTVAEAGGATPNDRS